MSMKTVDEENFDSDDDVAIIRCYKCTANFIDRDLYQEHVQEHEKDEFDAYKYRINTYDEYDAYNYKGPEAEGELDTSKEELQIPTIKCDECEEKFVSMIAFDDHCMYHKRQKVLEKLSKIEEALDKEKASDDKDDDSNLSVISSLSASDGDNPFSRKRSHSSESKTPFEQYSSYKRPPSREKSLERDFFRHSRERSLSSVSDSYHRYNRSRSRDRRSISTESFSRDSYYNSRFYSHHKRKRSSSLEHARKRGTRASHRSRYRDRSWSRSISRSRSRSRSRARSESWSSSDSSYRSYSSRRSRSFESISSDSGVSPSNIKGRDDIEKNLESALEEMAADYIEEEDKPLEKREKSPARKKSIDTFDWLASLQNPSQKRKKKREQKGKGKKKKYKEDQAAKSTRVEVKKQMVLPSNISYTPVTVAQVPIPQPIMMPQVAQVTASTPQYNLVQATSLQPIVGISASALPQWALQQSVIQQQTANTPTPLSQFANQQQSNLYKKSTVSNTTRHNLVSIQPTHFTTPTSTAAPIKGILKNVIKTTTTAVMQTIITPSISSSSRQLVQVQLAGPQFCGSKALTDMVQYGQQPTTSSQSVDLQPSHSQATKEIIQSTEVSNKSVPFTVSKVPQEPQIIPRPEKPMKRPIKIELGAESEETDEQFEPTGGKWDTVTMFFELTAEEEELRKKELVKDRFLLIQKSKLTSEPERSKLLKEIQRLKLIVHKLYHELVKCPTCDFHTRDPREYNRHQRTRCGNRLICHHCELTFVSQEETQAHLLTHKKICSLCSQIFYNESKYSEHIERHKKNIT